MAAKTTHAQGRKRSLAIRIALYAGAGVIGLVAFVLLINLYDPVIDQNAATAMRAAPAPVPDAENGYFVHYGLGVAAGKDPHAHGVSFVTANNAWMQSVDAGQPADRSNIDAMAKQNKAVSWRGVTKDLCGEERVDCFSAYVKNRSQVKKLVRDNQLRLARYRSLYRYKYYRDVSLNRVSSNWLPNFAGAEHETVLAQIALKAVDGNLDGALRDLVTDTTYWRRVLAGASTVVSKSLAANFLSRNYAIASEIATRYRDRPRVTTMLAEMVKPLTSEESSWKSAFIGEFQWVAYLSSSLRNHKGEYGFFTEKNQIWDRIVSTVLYKPNATVNLQYRYFEKLSQLADTPAHALADALRRVDAEHNAIANPFRADIVYNPTGKILVAIGAVSPSGYVRYVARTHNLEGAMRLLRLQLGIYSKKVAVKDVGTFVEKSPAELLDPYTNKPFRWDLSKREFWFEGINPKSENNATTEQRIWVRI